MKGQQIHKKISIRTGTEDHPQHYAAWFLLTEYLTASEFQFSIKHTSYHTQDETYLIWLAHFFPLAFTHQHNSYICFF